MMQFNVGDIAVDEVHEERVGEVMSYGEEEPGGPSYYFLRPLGGGQEWTAPPQYVRPATAYEILRAKNRALNKATGSRPQ